MRGYNGIMRSTLNVDLNGNGTPVPKNGKRHCLWTAPASSETVPAPLWHLHVSVVKNQETRGDCPSRKFAFPSLHHLTHATNQLQSAFGSTFDFRICGVETPDAMGGRVNDGRSENITIEYNTEVKNAPSWPEFLAKLKALEDEWEHEGMELIWKRDEEEWE